MRNGIPPFILRRTQKPLQGLWAYGVSNTDEFTRTEYVTTMKGLLHS